MNEERDYEQLEELSYEDAEAAPQESRLAAVIRHADRRVVVAVGAVAVAVLVGVIVAVVLAMIPKDHTIPNVMGLSQEDAKAYLDESGFFELGEVEGRFSTEFEPGRVLEQDPAPFGTTQEPTKINVVLSMGVEPAKQVSVPDIIGRDPSEAEEKLSRIGLVGRLSEAVFSDVEAGKVAAQSIEPGATATQGDVVLYAVSKGVETSDVPYVVGRPQDEGVSSVEEAGFTVMVDTRASNEYAAGTVCEQSVTGTMPRGSEVVLVVSTGAEEVDVPNVVGLTRDEAIRLLNAARFIVSENGVTSTTTPVGRIVSQSVSGRAPMGTNVTIETSV